MPLDAFNWREPDYIKVFEERAAMLAEIEADTKRGGNLLAALKVHYKANIADFVNDWGCTFDPRNVGSNSRPAFLPFVLFPRQREWINWFIAMMIANESAACEKSRDMGVSWLAVSVAASLCLFNRNMSVGFGSRKEEYVDKLGDPKCLFWKARQFIYYLPPIFTGAWTLADAPHMRLSFPDTDSFITGESGDNIGRGDRARVYVVDEAAYLERPQLIEASLSQTTNCRIDVSSANGTANPFYVKRKKWAGTPRLFRFHWRDDPRKDDAWYAKQVEDLDPVTVAQEIDIDYSASVEGVLIPSAWVQAAIGAAKKLGLESKGARRAALDVADEGTDMNALALGAGWEVTEAEEWSGKGSDLYATTVKAFGLCDDHGISDIAYDADGIGSNVRGDGKKINSDRKKKINTIAYNGGGGVREPKREDVPGRINEDFFKNAKAQDYWGLRLAFERTWRAVTKGIKYEADQLISLNPDMKHLDRVTEELSQPTYTKNEAGQIIVDKKPDGAASPNFADAIMMWRANADAGSTNAFFKKSDLLTNNEPVAYPVSCDVVFATLHSTGRAGKDNDGIAVIYWAKGRRGHPLVVLDWDITELQGTLLDTWVPNVYATLKRLAALVRARRGSVGVVVEDKGPGVVLLQQLHRRGNVTPIPEEIVKVGAATQALNVSGYTAAGKVRFSEQAVQRTSSYKGVDANHLLSQIGSFSADDKEAEFKALLRAFVYGVTIALGDGEGF